MSTAPLWLAAGRTEADMNASPVPLSLLQSWHNIGLPSPNKNNSIIKVPSRIHPSVISFPENDKGYSRKRASTASAIKKSSLWKNNFKNREMQPHPPAGSPKAHSAALRMGNESHPAGGLPLPRSKELHPVRCIPSLAPAFRGFHQTPAHTARELSRAT